MRKSVNEAGEARVCWHTVGVQCVRIQCQAVVAASSLCRAYAYRMQGDSSSAGTWACPITEHLLRLYSMHMCIMISALHFTATLHSMMDVLRIICSQEGIHRPSLVQAHAAGKAPTYIRR